MTAGVYAIVNTASGLVYVGSSLNISQRWSGRRVELDRGLSANKRLQADWLASGGQGFELRVLEEVASDEKALVEAEQRWIDHYAGQCYNVRTRVWRTVPGSPLPRLRDIRIAAGMSIRALAEKAGLAATTVVAAEQGRTVHYATRHKLANALDVEWYKLGSLKEEEGILAAQASWEFEKRSRAARLGWYLRKRDAGQPVPRNWWQRRPKRRRTPRPTAGAEGAEGGVT